MRTTITFTILVAALSALAGCDEVVAGTDGGTGDGGPANGPPAAPEIPWLEAGEPTLAAPAPPSFGCPSGWRTVASAGGVAACEPWPVGGRASCVLPEAHFPGEPSCARVGTACPADGWPVPPGGVSVIHVDAAAGPGGDGTRASPFATVTTALAASSAGTVVAVRAGTYDGAITIPAGVTVLGACVADTVLTSSAASDDGAVIEAGGADAVVRNLRITGERRGIQARSGASITVEDVWIEGARNKALHAETGGVVTARSVVARGTRGRASDSIAGRAAQVQEGGVIVAERAVFEQSHNAGAIAFDPDSRLELRAVAVLDTQGDDGAGGGFGSGVSAQDGPTVVLDAVVIERARESGISVLGGGATLQASNVVVRETLPQASDGSGGIGVKVLMGGAAALTAVLVIDSRFRGIIAAGPATSITAEDVLVQGVAAVEGAGYGIAATGGATVALDRVLIAQTVGGAVSVIDPMTAITLRDARVLDTEPFDAATGGLAISAFDGASLAMERVAIEATSGVGVQIDGSGTTATIADLRVSGARLADVVTTGGVAVLGDAELDAERIVLEAAGRLGVHVADGGSAELADVVCRDARLSGGVVSCVAVAGDRAASLVARRVLIEDVGGLGVAITNDASTLDLQDLVVRRVGAAGAFADAASGVGFFCAGDNQTTLSRARIEEASYVGVFVGFAATGTFEDLTVADTGAMGASDAPGAAAVFVGILGTASLTRAQIQRGEYVGLLVAGDGAVATLDGVAIEGVSSFERDGSYGRGASVQDTGRLEGRDLRIADTRESGLAVIGAGSRATLAFVEISGVRGAACAGTCDAPGGFGATVVDGATAELREFVVADSELAGVHLASGGEADLSHGVLRGNLVGVNIDTDGFDAARVRDDVDYVDNQIDLDTREVPPPPSTADLLPPR